MKNVVLVPCFKVALIIGTIGTSLFTKLCASIILCYSSQHPTNVGVILPLSKGRNQSTQNLNNYLSITELINIGALFKLGFSSTGSAYLTNMHMGFCASPVN